uniref:K-box domain-containing protein n=1 Tax=Salix viminalis TaxID=40686 RepID=A0A6N2MAV0_SALVM
MVCSRKPMNYLFFVMLRLHSSSSLAVVACMSTLTIVSNLQLKGTKRHAQILPTTDQFLKPMLSSISKKLPSCVRKLVICRIQTGIIYDLDQFVRWIFFLFRTPVKELKSLETKLEKGISRIRSKKNELLFAEIEYMQKREIDLHNNNQLLRAKLQRMKESDRT